MKIGNIETDNRVFLAPMAGVTDFTFRKIACEFGCGATYSEMVSAKGLYYKDKKTASLMRIGEWEKPVAIQIFGSEPDIMKEIVPEVEKTGADFIDINMGCPTPKIVNNGDGSALLKNLDLAGRVVRAVRDAANVPVTVKIRKGWDSDTAVEAARVLEANGADAITVHGRTREEFYRGRADWDVIKRVKDAVKIPVIGNGDVFSALDAKAMLEQTGCDAIMVARGAQGNPFIFREISEYLKTGKLPDPVSDIEKLQVARRHTTELVKDKGEARGIKESRKNIAWYIKGMRDSAAMKNRIFKAVSLAEIDEVFDFAMSNLE